MEGQVSELAPAFYLAVLVWRNLSAGEQGRNPQFHVRRNQRVSALRRMISVCPSGDTHHSE
jgi:hypothetical protein